ncbi:MAG: hypothetical protein R2741_13035 [Methanolobus sp.]
MDKAIVSQLLINNSNLKNTITIVLVCGLLNIITDLTIGLIPGSGDIANSVIGTILLIIQIWAITYLRSKESNIKQMKHSS